MLFTGVKKCMIALSRLNPKTLMNGQVIDACKEKSPAEKAAEEVKETTEKVKKAFE